MKRLYNILQYLDMNFIGTVVNLF